MALPYCLLIDGDAAFAQALRSSFGDWSLDWKVSAQDGLEHLEKSSADLVIVDRLFLDESEELQQTLANAAVPVLILSDQKLSLEELAVFCIPIAEAIQKPVLDFALLEHLARHLIEDAKTEHLARTYRKQLEEVILEQTSALQKLEAAMAGEKTAKADLLALRAGLERLLPLGLVLLKDHHVEYLSPYFAELIGDHFVGRSEDEFFERVFSSKDLLASLQKALRRDGQAQSQLQIQSGSGERVQLNLRACLSGKDWADGVILCAIDHLDLAPLKKQEPKELLPKEKSLSGEQPEVMLVSKEIDHHFFVRVLLERHGFQVSTYVDAESALIDLEGISVAAIVCDVPLCDMSLDQFVRIVDGRAELYLCSPEPIVPLPDNAVWVPMPYDMEHLARLLVERFLSKAHN